MTDRNKPEELSADDLDQAVGGVQSTAGTNPEGFKAGADLSNTVNKKKDRKPKEYVGETEKNFSSSAGGDPNV